MNIALSPFPAFPSFECVGSSEGGYLEFEGPNATPRNDSFTVSTYRSPQAASAAAVAHEAQTPRTGNPSAIALRTLDDAGTVRGALLIPKPGTIRSFTHPGTWDSSPEHFHRKLPAAMPSTVVKAINAEGTSIPATYFDIQTDLLGRVKLANGSVSDISGDLATAVRLETFADAASARTYAQKVARTNDAPVVVSGLRDGGMSRQARYAVTLLDRSALSGPLDDITAGQSQVYASATGMHLEGNALVLRDGRILDAVKKFSRRPSWWFGARSVPQ